MMNIWRWAYGIRTKTLGIAVLGVFSAVVVATLSLGTLRETMLTDRMQQLSAATGALHSAIGIIKKKLDAGQITESQAKEQLIELIHVTRYNNAGYFGVYSTDGIMVAHGTTPAFDGADMLHSNNPAVSKSTKVMLTLSEGGRSGFVTLLGSKSGRPEISVEKLYYASSYEPWGLVTVTGSEVDDISSHFWEQAWRFGLISLGVTILLATLGFWIGGSVSGSINSLDGKMRRLAEGDSDIPLQETLRRDEIGSMARAVGVFKESMADADRLRADQNAEQQRRIDRAERIEASIAGFEQAIGAVIGSVGTAAADLQFTAEAMADNSIQTSRQSTTVAASSKQASQNVQAVASATEELSASIAEIGQQIAHSTTTIAGAVQQTSGSNEQIQGLATAAERIGNVVKLINDIAGQTNLLALNATIEAARAGDSGKGFAVVASEVKALANQTARATEDITAQVNAIQNATKASAGSIQDVMQTITLVSTTTAAIAAAVEQQGAATREIARNVHQAFQGTAEVSSIIVEVSEAAQLVGTNADRVLVSATTLNRNGELLKRQVSAFLQEVRVG